MHKTKNLNDGYMGSGKLIKNAIAKYGIENFIKDILYIFDNENDMKNKERELVVLNEMSYNLCEGGKGGFGYINRENKNIYGKNGDPEHGGKNLIPGNKVVEILKQRNQYQKYCEKVSYGVKQYYLEKGSHWTGKKHSPMTVEKMKQSAIGKHDGSKNSQYGTCWVTNGSENKKVKKEKLDEYLKKGYTKGRIMRD